MELKPYSATALDEILAFAKKHPWKPVFPETEIRRFINELVSSTELVFDLHFAGQRVASAVLIDRIRNPGNLASLEVLGFRAEAGLTETDILDEIVRVAKLRVPAERHGLQVAFADREPSEFAERHGLTAYYQTFEMLNDDVAHAAPPAHSAIRPAKGADDERLYRALVVAFRENIEASLPDFAQWQQARHALGENSKAWLLETADEVTGFLTLNIAHDQKTAEIRTVGVLPEYRRKGYGEALIRRALGYLKDRGIPNCELTVAAGNREALGLYQRLGFREVSRSFAYRWLRGT